MEIFLNTNNLIFLKLSLFGLKILSRAHTDIQNSMTPSCGLSVTKWIHLNWGDDGIITLFVKIWSLLRPGGIFIMEPQPWTSYRKNRLVSEGCQRKLQ
uniref:RNA methyltransferase n=1 Tax=Aegilops tauschii subsp. strangulata TaxID=200361 RepID=A0A453RPT0_AEGTS